MAELTLPGDWTDRYAGSTLNLSSFKLSFADDFNSMDVAPNSGEGKWFAPARTPFGAAKFMSPDGAANPFSVSGGHLTIDMNKVDGAWQSGSMQTVNSVGDGFAQKYGYFEMRAAFHGGTGAWPAFWLLPQDTTVTRPEVDVVEAYGGDPHGHHHVVHLRTSQTHVWKSDYTGLDASMFDGAFHTYGAMITTDWITVFYDGKELSRFPMSDFFRTPLYMVVTLAMDPSGVAQASGRYDIVLDYVRAYAAPDVMERHLNGTAAADVLTGGRFDDVLDGRAGADKMSGGLGNDIYKVDNPSDIVVEAAGGGIDQVLSSVTYSLSGRQVEQLTLTGTAAINAVGNELQNTLVGNSADNALSGLSGNDTLQGGGGADRLDGGTGVDTMEGGSGNDTYHVDNVLDRLVENDAGGSDLVFSSATCSLPRYVENLILTGTAGISATGNSSDNQLTGNAANNVLSGLSGNDVITGEAGADRLAGYDGADILDGGAGADTMNGGAGNDTYYVDNVRDTVSDDSGVDHIFSSVGYSLSDRLVENLTLTGSSSINVTGNSLSNTLVGNAGDNKLLAGAGNDTLLGQGGNDVLVGGLGLDRLTGGAGNDIFVFDTAPNGSTNTDRITDFNAANDTIRLENAVMPALGSNTGTLPSALFWKSTSGLAHDGNDRIVYETDTGWLTYDSNGNAAGGAVHIAQLAPNLPLTYADFVVI